MDIPRPDLLKSRRRRRRFAAAAAVTALLALGMILAHLRPPLPTVDRTEVAIAAVKRGPMDRWISRDGTLVPAGPGRPEPRLEVRLESGAAAELRPGQAVQVDLDGRAGGGRIDRITPSAIRAVSLVAVAPDGSWPAAVADEPATARFTLPRLDDVLYVGRPGFGRDGATVVMFKIDPSGAGASRVRVRLGRASTDTIEVLDGLAAGDRVILSDLASLPDRIRLK